MHRPMDSPDIQDIEVMAEVAGTVYWKYGSRYLYIEKTIYCDCWMSANVINENILSYILV